MILRRRTVPLQERSLLARAVLARAVLARTVVRLAGIGAVALGFFACVGQPWTPKGAEGSDSGLASVQGPVEGAFNYDKGQPGRAAALSVDLATRHQMLDGYGAAVAWYQDRIVGKTPDGLYETLFSELGLDILRFRNRYTRLEDNDRDTKQEVEIFERGTKVLGHKPLLLLSSWSPPAVLKASGKERCKSNDDCTLKKEKGKFVYEGFAKYWADSVEYYRKLGLAPDFVSIQNEPDFIPPDWEGCKFVPEETAEYPGYGRALDSVHRALSKLDTPPALIGPEVLGIHYDRVPNFLTGMDSRQVYAVAHHIYERGNDGVWDWRYPGPTSFYDEMLDVRSMTDKPLWQTEFGTDEDKGWDGGFETAWLIHASMVEEGTSAFVYWDLIWDGARGLVGMLGRRPLVRDQYFSMRHFARFTDPGYVRVHTSTNHGPLLSSGWLSPDGSKLALVVLNTSDEMLDVSLDTGEFQASSAETFRTTYRPKESDRWRGLGAAGKDGVVRLPGRSVATIALAR